MLPLTQRVSFKVILQKKNRVVGCKGIKLRKQKIRENKERKQMSQCLIALVLLRALVTSSCRCLFAV